MKELEKVPKELKGSATLEEEQQYELTSTPRKDIKAKQDMTTPWAKPEQPG